MLRILDVMAQGGYLDRKARSVEVQMGVYSPGHRMFALVKLFFESSPTSTFIMRPSVHAVAASADHDTAAVWTASLLHLSWFALTGVALSSPLRTLYDRFRGSPSAPDTPTGAAPPRKRLVDPPAVHVVDAMLSVAHVAAAGAYAVALTLTARLPSAEAVGAAAFNRLYQDVEADARILLPAKEYAEADGEPVWQAGAAVAAVDAAAAAGAAPGQEEPACGVLQPTQLWAMPLWGLPSSTDGMRAFGRDLVCSLHTKLYPAWTRNVVMATFQEDSVCCEDAVVFWLPVPRTTSIDACVRPVRGWRRGHARGQLRFLVASG